MRNHPRSLFLTFIFTVLVGYFSFAQNNFGSEKELRKQADNYFKENDYTAAFPLYSQLLSLYPKDPVFNYKYGVCMLYAKENKEKPLPYLIFAAGKEDVDDDIYYHLGRAYHLNYRFDDAIAQYKIFKEKKKKSSTKLEVDLQIQQCENGKQLLKNISDLTVIDKREQNVSEYFRAYDLDNIGAKLVVKPDDLKTPYDIKKKEQSNIVIRQTSQDIYYSSYGADGKNGRDIYKISRLPNQGWGNPENLGSVINTPYDEDFPYLTPDGKTLYFCSKGHNSMGGYDIFRSELLSSGQWSRPVNLDFAINTPDDDIQYVTDPASDFAYFSSKRNSIDGKITVFKIRTERVPFSLAAIKGKVVSEMTPAVLAAKISIKNLNSGKFVGNFNSSAKDGIYRLKLNNGSKYEYTVEQPGLPPLTQIVEIPSMNEVRPLKQEIHLKNKDGATSMVIYNFFSDTVENNALETAELLKEKANLEVNYEEQVQEGIISEASINNAVADNKTLPNRNAYQEEPSQNTNSTNNSVQASDKTNNNLSNNKATATTDIKDKQQSGIKNTELLDIAKEDALETQKEADDLRDKSRQAYAFANLKNNAAQEKYKESETALNKATELTNIKDKQTQTDIAEKARKEGDLFTQQAIVSFNLAKELENEANNKQQEAFQAEQYAQDLEKAIASNSLETIEKYEKQNKEPEKENKPSIVALSDNLNKQVQEKNNELDRLEEERIALRDEIQDKKVEETDTQKALSKTKKEEEKIILQKQLEKITADKSKQEAALTKIESEIATLKTETEELELQAQINNEVINHINENRNSEVADIGAEDKQKLENQLSSLQNNNRIAKNKDTERANDKPQVNNTNTNSVNHKSSQNSSNITSVEDYTKYNNSIDESAKEKLQAEAAVAIHKADSISEILKSTTNNDEIIKLTETQKKYEEIAASKNLAANVISFNIYQKEYEGNKKALNSKSTEILESDTANYNNSLFLLENDYQKILNNKEKALSENSTSEKNTALSNIVNSQNIVLVRQRNLLEQANSSIAQNKEANKVTAEFKGINTDKNITAKEAVNELRPNYENYHTELTLNEKEAEIVRKSKEYIEFTTILKRAKELENAADNKAMQYVELKKQGEEKVIDSQRLIDLAAEEKKKDKRAALTEEAVRVDNEGRELIDNAEKAKVDAQNDMLKAAAIKSESDKYIESLTKEQQQKILAVYNNQIITESNTSESELAVNQSSGEDNQPITAINKTHNTENTKTVEPSKTNNNNLTEANNNNNLNTEKTTIDDASDEKNATVATPDQNQKIVGDKESILASIKAEPEYKGYASLKNEAEELKNLSESQKHAADSLKLQAERDAMNSNDLFEFAAAQRNKKDKKEAQARAEEMDKLARMNQEKADSAQIAASNTLAESNKKQNEADAYLKKIESNKATLYMMAYNNIVPDELLKTQSESMVAKNDNNTQLNNSNNTSKSSEINQTVQNIEPTVVQQNINQTNNNLVTNAPSKVQESAVDSELNNSKQGSDSMTVKVIYPDVKNTQEYSRYISLKYEVEKAEEEAKIMKARVDSAKALSQEKFEESNNKLEEAASLRKRKRKPLVAEAARLDHEAQLLENTADSLQVLANQANRNVIVKKEDSDKYIQSLDKNLALRIMRAIEGIPEPEVQTTTVQANIEKQDNIEQNTIPVITRVQTQAINSAPSHNSSNRIPMNPTLPDGIVFKVQIGAFNRPVADNAFGSVSPISGESIANSNLIRYTAGLFGTFEDAAKAKTELNNLKFNDAFIVAYCYGQRMSVTQARSLVRAGKDCKSGIASSTLATAQNVNTTTNITNTTTTNPPEKGNFESSQDNPAIALSNNSGNSVKDNLETGNRINYPTSVKQGETLPQQDIQTIKGLVYTVQVGVYSKPVKAGQLFNITPLYYELNQKGQYRYTSGIYNDIKQATAAKDEIVRIGVSDAFVTAYVNGQRIPMEQASAIEQQQGKGAFAQIQGMNEQPRVLQTETQNKAVPQNQPQVTTPITSEKSVAHNIIYKVQLGAFRNDVPVEIMNLYLSIADKGISNFKQDDLTIYTLGNFTQQAAAETVKNEVVAKGISDAFVIALNNGVKISLEEARKLTGNK
ncbi:MAG: PD40 domain-containing protein [Bacteroidia bacterium]|nr:PD40 domain-containing protein [Bacteroidia bacterium]MCZ2248329.1 hypothetical protein [Bacteroidia bacterium]